MNNGGNKMYLKMHGRMKIGTAENLLTEMLKIENAEIVIRDRYTKRDIRDDAVIARLRKKIHSTKF